MLRKSLRHWLIPMLCGVALLAAVVGRPAFLWVRAWLQDNPVSEEVPRGFADDASRLNQTPVAEVWSIPAELPAAETQLRSLLERARKEQLPVAIAGARHSMGGHTIYPKGIVLNMLPFNSMTVDPERRILHVGAGARWSEVVRYLDGHGFSVDVMQSNNDFSVGGSISVNCHGWQFNRPPIASTVESLRLMKANGSIMRCSRVENAELFSLVVGGYGLLGVILDVDLRIVANERYRAEGVVVPVAQFADRMRAGVAGSQDVEMAYGRLCVVPGDKSFLREAIFMVFRKAPCKKEEIPPLQSVGYTTLRRELYRAQIGSNAGKEVRWKAEKLLSREITDKYFSRNQLFNEKSDVYREQNTDRTDILHEYFVPPTEMAAFLDRLRKIIPEHNVDLLNVTVRQVLEDKDTFLRYADREMLSFVLLFNLPRTSDADKQMERLTRELIDAAMECHGRNYLPYRLHASRLQFNKAYPQAAAFFVRKREYDPDEAFQNQFYVKYGKP